jgi:plasmid stabilization system protein ParE
MNIRKADEFIADVELQFEWYVAQAGWDIAELYLKAVEVTCQFLGRHPRLGPTSRFKHPRLRNWRFFPVSRPFNRHVLFYELEGGSVIMRRAMHSGRDLPRRLLQPPGTG